MGADRCTVFKFGFLLHGALEETIMSDNKNNLVTRKEQEEMGLLKRPNNYPTKNYVALQGEILSPVRRLPANELNTVSHVIDVQPSATYEVVMHTNAVDRSKGFLVATVPLFAGLALGFVLISVFFFDVPFLSLSALVIFWLSFVGAWLVSYVYTLAVSAEGIAMFEARSKWKIIEREQAERWRYYNRQDGA
jgi:hypothetical protein